MAQYSIKDLHPDLDSVQSRKGCVSGLLGSGSTDDPDARKRHGRLEIWSIDPNGRGRSRVMVRRYVGQRRPRVEHEVLRLASN